MARRKTDTLPADVAPPKKKAARSKPAPDAPPAVDPMAPRLRRKTTAADAGGQPVVKAKAAVTPEEPTPAPAPPAAKVSASKAAAAKLPAAKAPAPPKTEAATPAPTKAPVLPKTAAKVAVSRVRTSRAPRREATEPLPAAVAAAAPPRHPSQPIGLDVVTPAQSPPSVELATTVAAALASAAPVAPEAPVAAAPILPVEDGRRPLAVLMVASEVLPFAKTGGLADVAAALPAALASLGHDVVVAMPRYRGVPVSGEVVATFVLDIGPEHLHVQVFRERLAGGAVVWLVDIPALYDREGFYGVGSHDHPDNPRRFAALARAAFEAAILTGFAPDIVHAHDWQGGLAPVYLRTRYATHPVLGGVPSVFTIHNIAYPGLCDPGWMPALDLDWDLYTPQALEYWGQVSLLKAGINFSEKVTTVSRRYAEEILTPEFAYGLEGVLGARRADLVGILNGIDADVWNPATDRFLPVPYHAGVAGGQAGVETRLARSLRPARGRRRPAAAAGRHGVADGRAEGARSHQQRRRRAAAPRGALRRARDGRAGVRGDVAPPGGAVPGSHRRAGRASTKDCRTSSRPAAISS